MLTPKEFALLEYLAVRAGTVVSRTDMLREHVYSFTDESTSNVVEAAVMRLRRKLSPSGEPQLGNTRRGFSSSDVPKRCGGGRVTVRLRRRIILGTTVTTGRVILAAAIGVWLATRTVLCGALDRSLMARQPRHGARPRACGRGRGKGAGHGVPK